MFSHIAEFALEHANLLMVLVTAFIGIVSIVAASRSAKLSSIQEMYNRFYYPLHSVLAKISEKESELSENDFRKYYRAIEQIFRNSNGYYPTSLKNDFDNLSPKTFRRFCFKIIQYHEQCKTRLGLTAPAHVQFSQLDRLHQMRIVLSVSLVVLAVVFFVSAFLSVAFLIGLTFLLFITVAVLLIVLPVMFW